MTVPNATEVQFVVGVVKIVADTIKELGSVPSGHLYANLCGFFSLEQYIKVLDFLKHAGLIKVENHLITWIGGN